MAASKKSDVEMRKESHIKVCLEEDVESDVSSGFEDVTLVHHAIVDVDRDEIDTTCEFLGKKMSAPLIVEAITGGARIAGKINNNLARACEEVGVAFGVGSVRAALVDDALWDTYKVRDVAPTIPILSNIGLVQLIDEYDIRQIKGSCEEIGADGVAIHLNAVQETVQPEGNVSWKGSFERLKYFCQNLGIPVVVKETGAGISYTMAKMLHGSGVSAIDVGGLGGTSLAAAEIYRANAEGDELGAHLGNLFGWNWGISTVESIVECRALPFTIPIIATGGIRNGLDIAKGIALGSDMCSAALPFLKPAMESGSIKSSVDKVVAKITEFSEELKVAMFLTGCKNTIDLKDAELVITGETREIMEQRGVFDRVKRKKKHT